MELFISGICVSIFLFFQIIGSQKKYTEYIFQKNERIQNEKKLSKKDGVDYEK